LRLIRDAEVRVRPALPRPVAHLLCNRQVLHVVLDGLGMVPLDGLGIVPLRRIRVAEALVRPALPRPVAHLLCNRQESPGPARGTRWPWNSPLRLIRAPEVPYAQPSPARSPTSFAIKNTIISVVKQKRRSPNTCCRIVPRGQAV
jgi:hypothetical protein